MRLTYNELLFLSEQAILAAQKALTIICKSANKKIEVDAKVAGESLSSQVVTQVDTQCETAIIETLNLSMRRFDLGLLTEERTDDGSRLEKDYFWCVDPLDGTLSFIEGKPGYSVSIALVSRSGTPIIGVVCDPVTHATYSAIKDFGAFKNGMPWRVADKPYSSTCPLTLVCDPLLDQKSIYTSILSYCDQVSRDIGLDGLKVLQGGGAVMNTVWVLENAPAVYFKLPKPQTGGGSCWDFAATSCIFSELAVPATDYFGSELRLNCAKTTFMNERGVVYCSDAALLKEISVQSLGHFSENPEH